MESTFDEGRRRPAERFHAPCLHRAADVFAPSPKHLAGSAAAPNELTFRGQGYPGRVARQSPSGLSPSIRQQIARGFASRALQQGAVAPCTLTCAEAASGCPGNRAASAPEGFQGPSALGGVRGSAPRSFPITTESVVTPPSPADETKLRIQRCSVQAKRDLRQSSARGGPSDDLAGCAVEMAHKRVCNHDRRLQSCSGRVRVKGRNRSERGSPHPQF